MSSTASCTTYSSVSVSTSIVSTTVVTSSFSSTLPYPTTAATAKASQPLNPDNYCPENFPYYYQWCNLCYNYANLACNATGPDPCIIPGNCNSCQAGNVLAASCVTEINPVFNPSVTILPTTYTSTLIHPTTVYYSTPVAVSTSCPTLTPAQSTTNVGAIAGGAAGGIVVIAIAILAFFLWRRRKRTPHLTAYAATGEGAMGARNMQGDIGAKNMQGDRASEKFVSSTVVSPGKLQYDGTVPTSPLSDHTISPGGLASSRTSYGFDARSSSTTWDSHRSMSPQPERVGIQSLAHPRTTVSPPQYH